MSKARSLAIARSISEFGNSLRFIAFPLGILRVQSNPAHIATAEIIETAAAFAAGVIIPVFIDRLPKRLNLVIADLLSLSVTATMAYAVYRQSLPLLLISAFWMAATAVFHENSLSAATADLTEGQSQRSLIQGFSRLQLFTLIFGFAGSLAGANIVAKVPLYLMFAVDAGTFLVSSVWIYFLLADLKVAPKAIPAVTTGTTLRHQLIELKSAWTEGLEATLKERQTFRFILAQGILAIGHGLLVSSIISHYKVRLRVPDSFVALAQANNRVWQFLGTLLLMRISWTPRKTILTGVTLMVGGYFAMSLTPFFGFLVAYGFQQLGNAFVTPTNRALVMQGTESRLRGRVASFRGLIIDLGILVGNGLGLATVAWVGTSASFVLASGMSLVALVVYSREPDTTLVL